MPSAHSCGDQRVRIESDTCCPSDPWTVSKAWSTYGSSTNSARRARAWVMAAVFVAVDRVEGGVRRGRGTAPRRLAAPHRSPTGRLLGARRGPVGHRHRELPTGRSARQHDVSRIATEAARVFGDSSEGTGDLWPWRTRCAGPGARRGARHGSRAEQVHRGAGAHRGRDVRPHRGRRPDRREDRDDQHRRGRPPPDEPPRGGRDADDEEGDDDECGSVHGTTRGAISANGRGTQTATAAPSTPRTAAATARTRKACARTDGARVRTELDAATTS